MTWFKHILIFCVGIPFGLYFGIYIVIAGSNKTVLGRVAGVIEAPVMLLTELFFPAASYNTPTASTTRMGFFMIVHLLYWCTLFGLTALGIAAAWRKLLNSTH